MKKKILLWLICLSLLLSSCVCTPEYVYIDNPITVEDYPEVPEVEGLILEPTTKEDYRHNVLVLAYYTKQLKEYINIFIKKEAQDKPDASQ